MKEFICHSFLQLKSNWVIEILIRLAQFFASIVAQPL